MRPALIELIQRNSDIPVALETKTRNKIAGVVLSLRPVINNPNRQDNTFLLFLINH